MCIDPTILPDGTLVACRTKCWQCIKNYINDYVGRCIAEQRHSTIALPVTLTYSGDSPNNAVLIYEDFQNFMKRLRRRGYKVRYIVAGEYGEKKGRAHWHAVLFFTGKYPEIVDHPSKIDPDKPEQIFLARFKNDPWARNQWAPWSNKEENRGHVYFQPATYEGFQYVMKYVVAEKEKDIPQSEKKLGQSKKPPLGHAYFLEKAESLVAQRLVPLSYEYTFADVFDSKGKRKKFWLQGKSRENFMEYFIAEWRRQYGDMPPHNELMDDYIDKTLNRAIRERADAEQEKNAELLKEKTTQQRYQIGVDLVQAKKDIQENKRAEAEAKEAILDEYREKGELIKSFKIMKGHWRKIPCVVSVSPQEDDMTVQYGKEDLWQSEDQKEIRRWLSEFKATKSARAGDIPKLAEDIEMQMNMEYIAKHT